MITCRPDWVSELSSNELHDLVQKTVPHSADSELLREYEETAETLFQKLADVLGSVEDFANGIENRHITLEPLANAIVAGNLITVSVRARGVLL